MPTYVALHNLDLIYFYLKNLFKYFSQNYVGIKFSNHNKSQYIIFNYIMWLSCRKNCVKYKVINSYKNSVYSVRIYRIWRCQWKKKEAKYILFLKSIMMLNNNKLSNIISKITNSIFKKDELINFCEWDTGVK